MTFAEKIADIRVLLDDTTAKYLCPDARIKSLINKEIQKIYDKIALAGRGTKVTYKEYTFRTDAVADSNYKKYALPDDFLSLVGEERDLVRLSGETWIPMSLVSGLNTTYHTVSEGTPSQYDVEGEFFYIDRAPSNADTAKFYYIPKFVKLSADEDVLPFPDDYGDSISTYVLYMLKIMANAEQNLIYAIKSELNDERKNLNSKIKRGRPFKRIIYDPGNGD